MSNVNCVRSERTLLSSSSEIVRVLPGLNILHAIFIGVLILMGFFTFCRRHSVKILLIVP